MREDFSQPSQATRRCSCSNRCSVAIRAPWAPSTSIHAWSASGVVPRAAEGHEGRAPLLEEPRLRRAGIGVGHHECVDRRGAQQVVVAVERVVRVAGEEQHVMSGARGRFDQAVQEPVHQRVAAALRGCLEAQADQVGGARPELPGRAVGRVAESLDHRLHPFEGVRPQQIGVVQRVGDGLPGNPRLLRDRRQGRWHLELPSVQLGPIDRLAHHAPRDSGSFQS